MHLLVRSRGCGNDKRGSLPDTQFRKRAPDVLHGRHRTVKLNADSAHRAGLRFDPPRSPAKFIADTARPQPMAEAIDLPAYMAILPGHCGPRPRAALTDTRQREDLGDALTATTQKRPRYGNTEH